MMDGMEREDGDGAVRELARVHGSDDSCRRTRKGSSLEVVVCERE
jgi:hypothetical protein